MSKTTFQTLFRAKEFVTLSGRRRRNIVILSLVTLSTFLSVGFALGGLNYLAKKLDDPFVKQLSFQANKKITGVDNSEAIKTVQSWSDEFQFNAKNVTMYGPTFNRFLDVDGKPQRRFKGRGMSAQNPVLKDLLGSDNLSWFSPTANLMAEMDDALIRIILKESFLEKHGFDALDPPSYIRIFRPGLEPRQVPVLAVVKELPDKANYVLSHNAWLALTTTEGTIPKTLGNELLVYVKGLSKSNEAQIHQELRQEAQKANIAVESIYTVPGKSITEPSRWSPRNEAIVNISMPRGDTSNYQLAAALGTYLEGKSGMVLYPWGSIDQYKLEGGEKYFENMTVYFNDLKQVEPFTEKLIAEFDAGRGIEVDLSSLKNKDNLRLFSGLAKILAVFLIAFSVLSITTFVNSLISSHFQKIQKNLGTLKAFGLSTGALISAYARISLTFVVISASAGYLVALALGLVGTMRLVMMATGLPLDKDAIYFDLFNVESALTFIVIVATSFLFVWLNLRKMLKNTPGELIYGRV